MNKNLYYGILTVVAMTIVHFSAIPLGFYDGEVWVDKPLHFFGGILSGFFLLYAMSKEGVQNWLDFENRETVAFSIVTFSVFLSYIWEFFEFLFVEYASSLSKSLKLYSPTVNDLVFDVAFGLLGGVVFSIVYLASSKGVVEEE